jgi:predicted transcriptional regulator
MSVQLLVPSSELWDRLETIAIDQQKTTEQVLNEALLEYVERHQPQDGQSGAAYLLSMAGVFASGHADTSERVKEIVAQAIREKHGKVADGSNH